MHGTVKLFDNIWAFEEGFVRSFLILGKNMALQVDTGVGETDLAGERGKLTSLPTVLVNTHSDRDHIGGNGAFTEIYAHPADIDAIEKGSGTRPAPLEDGHVFDLGGVTLNVFHTPGHTPGSIMLFYREAGILFSGDMLSEAEIFMFGAGRDHRAFVESIRGLGELEGQVKHILPCHGKCPLEGMGELARDEIAALKDYLAGRPETDIVHPNGGPLLARCWRHGRASIMCELV